MLITNVCIQQGGDDRERDPFELVQLSDPQAGPGPMGNEPIRRLVFSCDEYMDYAHSFAGNMSVDGTYGVCLGHPTYTAGTTRHRMVIYALNLICTCPF